MKASKNGMFRSFGAQIQPIKFWQNQESDRDMQIYRRCSVLGSSSCDSLDVTAALVCGWRIQLEGNTPSSKKKE